MAECCKVQMNYVILHYVILHNRLNCQEMNLLSNPFVIGKYVDKDYFCDREKESEMLVHHIVNGRNVAIMSERRLGKTGLIEHVFTNSLNMAKVFPQHWWSDSINAFKASPGICSSR